MMYAQNLVLGLVLGQRAGLSTRESLQPALVAGALPNAMLGIVVADQMIKRQIAARPPQGDAPPPGTSTVVVPDLLSQSPSEARTTLEVVGLRAAARDEQVADDRVPRGQVAAQRPAAKSVVARGTEVLLFVSRGVPVPKVTRLLRGEAVEQLIDAGFSSAITEVPGDKDDRDRVLEQIPAAGEFPADGHTVELRVSIGIPAIVPGVLGQTRREAVRSLGKSHLEAVLEDRESADSDIVVAQDPKSGTVVAQQSAVTLRLRAKAPPYEAGAGAARAAKATSEPARSTGRKATPDTPA